MNDRGDKHFLARGAAVVEAIAFRDGYALHEDKWTIRTSVPSFETLNRKRTWALQSYVAGRMANVRSQGMSPWYYPAHNELRNPLLNFH